MQQFTVPQFIDVEDKIIGAVTTRQFVIILFGAIFIAIFYKIFDFSLFVFSGVITFIISIVFAFIKINGRPFHYFVLNFIQTMKRANLRVWTSEKINESAVEMDDMPKKDKPIPVKNLLPQASRLDELSLIVDTQGAYKGEEKNNLSKI